MEIWKDILGWEGVYQISSLGRLKSFKKDSEGYVLKNNNSKGDYFSVVLRYKKKKRSVRIHVLVAELFVANPLKKPHVNHKDGNKQNNDYTNLEWVTHAENMAHAFKNGRANYSAMVNRNLRKARVIVQFDLKGKPIKIYENSKSASETTGVCRRNILQVASLTEYKPGLIRSQAGGYKWKYFSDYEA